MKMLKIVHFKKKYIMKCFIVKFKLILIREKVEKYLKRYGYKKY